MTTPDPVAKTPVTCCGYTAHLGVPKPWECPGCGTVHVPEGYQPPS